MQRMFPPLRGLALRRRLRERRGILALGAFVLSTIGSCGMPQIKPPGLG